MIETARILRNLGPGFGKVVDLDSDTLSNLSTLVHTLVADLTDLSAYPKDRSFRVVALEVLLALEQFETAIEVFAAGIEDLEFGSKELDRWVTKMAVQSSVSKENRRKIFNRTNSLLSERFGEPKAAAIITNLEERGIKFSDK